MQKPDPQMDFNPLTIVLKKSIIRLSKLWISGKSTDKKLYRRFGGDLLAIVNSRLL